jgi:hypothetical protein
MRPHGRAKVSTKNPRAFAICDRCQFLYNHYRLSWQFDWAGPTLKNKQILVCKRCLDEYQEGLRAIVLPVDPVPIANPRVQNYSYAANSGRQTSGQNNVDFWTGIPIPEGDTRVTSNSGLNGGVRVTQQTGEPPGGHNTEPGTDPNAPGNDDPGLPYDNTEVPKTGPLS